MDQGEPAGPEHLNRAGTRQEEGVGILPLSACFLLLCVEFFFFFLIPRSNQEVIGIPKKGHQVRMESRSCVRSLPPKMSAAANVSMGLTGGRDGVRRDEWINTRGDEGMGWGGGLH